MQSEELYRQILGLVAPWTVTKVDARMADGKVEVFVQLDPSSHARCPECNEAAPRHDTRQRSWRHLDTCQLQTVLTADVPRVHCKEHGVHQMRVPWAEPGSRFTAMFEALVLDWLQAASFAEVGRLMGLSWDQVDGVAQRGVKRGLARRKAVRPKSICVDEKSFLKRHNYVTVVSDRDTGHVLHVAEGRGKAGFSAFFDALPKRAAEGIRWVSMDMHAPYIAVASERIPDGASRICFDRFHVTQHLNKAVDKVRAKEHRELTSVGDSTLTKTKYDWLRNAGQMSTDQWSDFEELRESALRTARAWSIKETFLTTWDQWCGLDWYEEPGNPGGVRTDMLKTINWGRRSRLEPVIKAMGTLRNHLDGIVRACLNDISNAGAESINSRIQFLKCRAHGYRNRERFINAIYFYLGGLDLYPAPCDA